MFANASPSNTVPHKLKLLEEFFEVWWEQVLRRGVQKLKGAMYVCVRVSTSDIYTHYSYVCKTASYILLSDEQVFF